MKIGVVMLYDEGRREYGDVTSSSARNYCQCHGYDLLVRNTLIDATLPASWNKLLALQQHLDSYDWLFWLDADALILRDDLALEELITRYGSNKELVFSVDASGLCAGIFLIKNTEWSKDFLRTVLFLGEEREVGHLFEQKTIVSMYNGYPSIQSHIGTIPETLIQNHRSEFSPDAFIMHFWAYHFPFNTVDKIIDKIKSLGWRKEHFPKHYFARPTL